MVPILKFFYFALLIILILLYIVVNTKTVSTTKDTLKLEDLNKTFLRRNCNAEIVYSMSDEDCLKVCQSRDSPFVSHNGVCLNQTILDSQATDYKCDPMQGVFGYLSGNPQFGTTEVYCLSVDPGIRPDDIDLPNELCHQTCTLQNINYFQKMPNEENITCPNNTILLKLDRIESVRDSFFCVIEKSIDAYILSHNNKVY